MRTLLPANRLVAGLLAAVLPGCSFAFVSGPPANHEKMAYVDCTESRAAPVLDTLFGALQVANTVYAASSTNEAWARAFNGKPPLERSTAIPLYIGLAALGAAGAVYGYKTTGECREAIAQAQARAEQNRRPISPVPPPPPPAVAAEGETARAPEVPPQQ